MEINFKKLSLDCRARITELLADSDRRFCEYTFGNMFCWGARYDMEICLTQDGFITGSPQKATFGFPVGKDAPDIIKALTEKYDSFTLSPLSESDTELLSQSFDGFEFEQLPRKFDYIYESERLMTLSGKKLAAKRNHINAFEADGDFYTEPITSDNIDKLFDFNDKWCAGLCKDKDSSLYSEMCAVRLGLDNFVALGFSGLVLYKNGRICAYSYGEPINSDTFCVHVEKADADIRGAYQMINREFARAYCSDYKYINREDDAGDEGLRRAKLSYYPTEVGKKFKAVYKK